MAWMALPLASCCPPSLVKGKELPVKLNFPHLSSERWKPHSSAMKRAWTAFCRQDSFALPDHPEHGGMTTDQGGEDIPTAASTITCQKMWGSREVLAV